MAGELRAIEELLRDEIGLDPASVGPQLILRAAQAADDGPETERPGRIRASGQAISDRASGADRRGHRRRELVLP